MIGNSGSGRPRTRHRNRRVTATVLLALGLLLLSTPSTAEAAPPKIVLNANQTAAKNALNRDRKAYKLSLLVSRLDAQLKAQAWANQLARDGYLHHSKLTDGITGRWCSLAENVGKSTYGIADVEARFMQSPIHRKNILTARFNSVGIGYATGGGNVYVVQVFVRTC